MGIPKFYRWLSERYPLISQYLDESHEFDNFYLDMNGIIHQCTHPNEDELVDTDLPAMFDKIFQYTDRLYKIVRPRKLLFLAVDGVAPRAKVNQQRSRRFRSAKDNEKLMMEKAARKQFEMNRNRTTSSDEESSATDDSATQAYFDSNCITPGTPFMAKLSQAFKKWLDYKMSTDPVWQQGCNVVFSGCEVPGEGEHKIMDCIREWRNSPSWEPTVRHCMYGLDADLIMLGLVTHEPHFTLLRERLRHRGGKRRVPSGGGFVGDAEDFELLEIALLRDMLYVEFKPQPNTGADLATARYDPRSSSDAPDGGLSFKYESHRVVDDFVFMCMLVGNDFVPHISHLDISEGALNIMFRVYKELMLVWGGYLTDAHRLHPDRLEEFLMRISERTEVQHFRNKARDEDDSEYASALYKQHYYKKKLAIDIDTELDKLLAVKSKYLEGLHWVLQYYHNGCQSWSWYYPYLYAPLATDMVDLRSIKIRFQRGRPFSPLTQLLAVLPPISAPFLPPAYRKLMTSTDSAVIDFYPEDFDVDPNGKKNAWEAVVLIPFIDENRLLDEIDTIDRKADMTSEEVARDRMGTDKIFLAKDYPRSDMQIAPMRPDGVFSSRTRRSSRGGRGGRGGRGSGRGRRGGRGGERDSRSNSGRSGIGSPSRQSSSSSPGSFAKEIPSTIERQQNQNARRRSEDGKPVRSNGE